MKRSEAKLNTAAKQYLKWFIIALICGIAALVISYQIGFHVIDHNMSSDAYQDNNKKTYVEPLRNYISENGVRSTDGKLISAWVNDMPGVAVKVFDENTVIYENYYLDPARLNYSIGEPMHATKFEYLTTYPVQFADGTFKAYINSANGDRVYYYLLFLAMAVGVAVFLAVFLAGITRRAKYIAQLKNDMEILGSGDLNHEITIKGNDELAYIAESLEQMRVTLLEHMEEEERLAKGNREIVSKLSHDIRTPLTSMVLFADLLKDGKYRNDEQRDHYIDRIQSSVAHLTDLTDQIMSYTRDEKPADSGAKQMQTDFDPLIARAVEELTIRGFRVEAECDGRDLKAVIEPSSATRIVDNIVSNIINYADDKEPVHISCSYNSQGMTLEFTNGCRAEAGPFPVGNGVGLRSVETLMKQSGGEVRIDSADNCFRISLLFN